MMRGLFIAVSLIFLPAPLLAATGQAADVLKAPSGEARQLGYDIAVTTNSEALTRIQLEKMLDETLPKQLAADPTFVELEARFPGLSAKIVATLRPVMISGILPMLPQLWQRLGPVYAENLTESELRDTLAFYRSPVGVRFIDAMGRGADYSRIMNESLKSGGEAKITADGLRSGMNIGIQAVNNQMSKADLAAISKFEGSSIGPKLRVIGPKMQALAADWANEPSPELNAKIEAAMKAVLQPYLEGKPGQ